MAAAHELFAGDGEVAGLGRELDWSTTPRGPVSEWSDTQAIHKAIRDKTVFELEHRVLRPDGTLRWALSRAVPLLDDAGQITEWIGAATDRSTQYSMPGE
ncbi:MAG: hypothetical protein QOI16_1508 [Pseudonocardiales bacterium]|nr:hypothetical protein [Pseudonocardiales bacterium]